MTHTSVLFRLQTVDSEADAGRARLDEINTLLGENEEVRAARNRLSEAEERMNAAQARVTDLELEIAGLDSKVQNTSDRLYSGTVKNPKELQDMEQEIEALGRRRETLEESLLEAMVLVEEGQKVLVQARSALEATESSWAASQGDMVEEKRDLEERLSELEAKREETLTEVDSTALAAYDNLRARLGGVAVAMVRDGVCTSCGVAPTSSVAQKARHGELDARCSVCGRILYGD